MLQLYQILYLDICSISEIRYVKLRDTKEYSTECSAKWQTTTGYTAHSSLRTLYSVSN